MRGDTVGAFNGRQYTVSTSATRKREEGKEGRELGGEVHYRIKKGSNVKSIKGRKGSAALPDSLKEIRMCVQEEVCAAQKPVGRGNKGMRRREREESSLKNLSSTYSPLYTVERCASCRGQS